MKEHYGATSLGESQHRFKTDVNLSFGNQHRDRKYVLRTTLHSLSVWKTRNPGVGLSPFKIKNLHMIKEAAIVDHEVWVFNVNGSTSRHYCCCKGRLHILQRIASYDILGYLCEEFKCRARK